MFCAVFILCFSYISIFDYRFSILVLTLPLPKQGKCYLKLNSLIQFQTLITVLLTGPRYISIKYLFFCANVNIKLPCFLKFWEPRTIIRMHIPNIIFSRNLHISFNPPPLDYQAPESTS